jgi:hypothetical protein
MYKRYTKVCMEMNNQLMYIKAVCIPEASLSPLLVP